MTRKDYEMMAKVVFSVCDGNVSEREYQTVKRILNGFADNFIAENPRFDHKLFMQACGFAD